MKRFEGEEEERRLLRERGKAYQSLVLASGRGDLAEVRSLVLDRKTPVELSGHQGPSPLQEAAARGHAPVVDFLLERGADVLRRDGDGRTLPDLAEDQSNLRVRKSIGSGFAETSPPEGPARELWSRGHSYSYASFRALAAAKDVEGLRFFLAADRIPTGRSTMATASSMRRPEAITP